MNLEETAHLLTFCASFDSRTIGASDAVAWNKVLGWASFAEAQEAVADFYGRETRRVMPADVIAGVKRIRRARLDHADATFVPDCDPDDVAAFREQLAAHRRAIGDGSAGPEQPALTRDVDLVAIDAKTFRSVPGRRPRGSSPRAIEGETA